jgi:hypothetical protein
VSCTSVVKATDDASLTAALAKATAGACVALTPGSYGTVNLTGGVSLLGKGVELVSVGGVTVSAGKGSVIRGITVKGGGTIQLNGATETRIDSVHVLGASGDGVSLRGGSSAIIISSDIESSGRYGVSTFDSGDLTMQSTFVHLSRGPGVWAECTAGCGCAAPSSVGVKQVRIRDTKVVGMSLVGVKFDLDGVEVSANTEGNDFKPSGGIAISQCASGAARATRVIDNSSYGILVDQSTLMLGGADPVQGFEVSRNLIGLWVQNITRPGQTVNIQGGKLEANLGIGIGMSGASRGIIISGTDVRKTSSVTLPVVNGSSASAKDVGDGLTWMGKSEAKIDGLSLSGNARASLLIDGDVAPGSSIANVTQSDGDEAKGIVQQNVAGGGVSPSVGAGAPAILQSVTEKYAIPVPPLPPSSTVIGR